MFVKNNLDKTENNFLIKSCALLIHAAKIDENYTENEEEIIKKTLLELGADKKDISKIIQEAKTIEENSNQILSFTKEVKNLPEADKIKIIEALWSIIYSNNEADIYETNLMRRLAGLLYIDNSTIGNIKDKIKKFSDDIFPPVDSWNPDLCEGQEIRIDRNGDWFYNGSLIKNRKIVKLFSKVLRNDDGDYFLVTPAEKVPVNVEIAPYMIIDFDIDTNKNITFHSNFNYSFKLDFSHPVYLKQVNGVFLPIVNVRPKKIEGFLARNVYYRFLNFATEEGFAKNNTLYINSFKTEVPVGKIN